MKDDISDIQAMYNNDPENEDNRLERHQLEYDLTMRYLQEYLPKRGRILEIGAATGVYTLPLARMGYEIIAVDISAVEVEMNKKRIRDAGLEDQVDYIEADARDLSKVIMTDFDVVLLMGPLYHLIEEEDRKTALQQAVDRLKPGGLLISAHICRHGIMGDLIRKIPDWIEFEGAARSILDHGKDPVNYPRGGFRGYFATVAEITPLHESVGLETLVLAAVEPAISADDESYNNLEGNQRALWLDLLYELSTEASSMGASRHLLYIGQKPK